MSVQGEPCLDVVSSVDFKLQQNQRLFDLPPDQHRGLSDITRLVSISVLLIYSTYLVFSLLYSAVICYREVGIRT